jgi:hypothetical protein
VEASNLYSHPIVMFEIILSIIVFKRRAQPVAVLPRFFLYSPSGYGCSFMFSIYPDLIQFLQNDLAMSSSSIDFALKRSGDFEPLPMILWQYGLVSLEQLDRIYDWLDSAG